MFCPNCGRENEEGKVCSGCGQNATLGDSVVKAVSVVEYGGFWRRFAALLIDGVLLGIINLMMVFIVGDVFANLVNLVVGWLYFSLLESSEKQATLGKMALGIKVTDLAGNRLGFGRATGRYFAKILSWLILMIGFIMAAFTEKKQGLHDMLAGTLVVVKK